MYEHTYMNTLIDFSIHNRLQYILSGTMGAHSRTCPRDGNHICRCCCRWITIMDGQEKCWGITCPQTNRHSKVTRWSFVGWRSLPECREETTTTVLCVITRCRQTTVCGSGAKHPQTDLPTDYVVSVWCTCVISHVWHAHDAHVWLHVDTHVTQTHDSHTWFTHMCLTLNAVKSDGKCALLFDCVPGMLTVTMLWLSNGPKNAPHL